jgi:hypothetical protein
MFDAFKLTFSPSFSWISHGADASERYRSFARPAVFSQDRLTFTMANHLKEQKSHHNCKLLLDELNRVINEEMRLRTKLLEAGVRDISNDVRLPQNKVDQLDEDSADYDDKRMCFSCKHICFYSCVACECSRSKVSCLRHSHYMCRCPVDKKYMMVWSTADEMYKFYDKVKEFFVKLNPKVESSDKDEGKDAEEEKDNDSETGEVSAELAPGVVEDMKRNEGYLVDMSETSPLSFIPRNGQLLLEEISSAKRKQAETEGSEDSIEKKVKLDNGVDGKQISDADLTEETKSSDVPADQDEEAGSDAEIVREIVEIIDESDDDNETAK